MKYIRQRYILFEVICPSKQNFNKEVIIKAIGKKLIKFFGEYNTFKVGLWMIRWDPQNQIGILRVDNVSKYHVISAMFLIKEINSSPVIFHTRKTSGTIKRTLKIWRQIFSCLPPRQEKR
ncbi:MAG: Rpp14/Pop5 family protein [Promethearchaeota archaeon]